RVIAPDVVLGPDAPGARRVYIGDIAAFDDAVREDVSGAHTLGIEGTYVDGDGEMADAFGPMTYRRAARFAHEMGVGTVILTHVSRRYRELDIIREEEQHHPHAFVARDFDRFLIAKGRLAQKIDSSAHPVEDDDSAHLDDLELTPLEGQ